MDTPRLAFTRLRDLALAAGVGAFIAAGLLLVTQAVTGNPPLLPWTGPLVLLFMAAIVGAIAFTTWRRVQVRRERIEPERGIRSLALGKASALGGAAIAAGYLVVVFFSAGTWEAAGPQQRMTRGAVAAAAGASIMAAGLWLERACRVPHSPDEDDEDQAISGD